MLSHDDRKALLEIAREAIRRRLSGGGASPVSPKSPVLLSKRGAFVTVTKAGELRGCLGTIEPEVPLFEAVAEMARAAAFHDPRFAPLKPPELSEIRIEISVLSPLERLREAKSVVVGQQGLLVRRGSVSGLLLPQVASSHGWSQEEFLRQTCIKAGLLPESYLTEGTELFSFTAEVFSEEDV